MTVYPMPPGHPSPRTVPAAQNLLRLSRQLLADAAEATHPNIRYSTAHLAALRAAAAVLAVREPASAPRRGRPRSAWVLLAAAEAGLPDAATLADAEILLHDAGLFVTLVEDTLGISTQQSLPMTG